MIQLPFSANLKDQIKLMEAGGYIALKPNDKFVFQFDSREDYKKYMEVKANEKNDFIAAHS